MIQNLTRTAAAGCAVAVDSGKGEGLVVAAAGAESGADDVREGDGAGDRPFGSWLSQDPAFSQSQSFEEDNPSFHARVEK